MCGVLDKPRGALFPQSSRASTTQSEPGAALFLNYCHFHTFSQEAFPLLQDTISINYLPLCNHVYKADRDHRQRCG